MKTLFMLFSTLTASLFYSGCDSSCCQDVALVQSIVNENGNQTPVPVIVGLPATAPCGIELIADGKQSYDKDGTIVKYAWELDGTRIAADNATAATLPCDGQNHEVCLQVTDNMGASQMTCQTILVDNSLSQPMANCDINPEITYSSSHALEYEFSCTDSTYEGVKISASDAQSCVWRATETYTDGTTKVTTQTGPVKLLTIDPETFQSMDLTLTVKAGDCEKSVTKHYLLSQE